MSLRKLAGWSRCALGLTSLCAAFPDASAHSEIDLPPPHSVSEELVTAQYRIVHACTTNAGKPIPVIAQSFMLPTQNPLLSRADGGTIEDTDGSGTIDLMDITYNGSFTGMITPIINRSVFQKIQRKTDALENAVGFSSTDGEIPNYFYADLPFALTPIFFVESSCAREIVVHPVGADICRITKNPREGDVNIWMEHTTAKFPNPVHGVGENALRISYKRNLKSTPLEKRCGKGYTVDVFASDEDIDAHLPIPGVWPKP